MKMDACAGQTLDVAEVFDAEDEEETDELVEGPQPWGRLLPLGKSYVSQGCGSIFDCFVHFYL